MTPALRKCSEPGCHAYVTGGKCEAHSKASSKNRSGDAFYSSKRWRKLRWLFLSRNPLCCECERQGLVKAATEVDHVLPRCDRPDLEWDWSNLAAMCKSHHSAKTMQEQQRKRNGNAK